MALLMRRVSKMPEAPTRVPAMISRFEPRVKPEAATASPVKELSSEMSTGTSAPPMGSTKATPRTKATASKTQSSVVELGDQDRDDECRRAHANDRVDDLLAGVGDGTTGHELLELREGDRRAGEGHGADQDTEQHLEDDVGRGVRRLDVDELGDRHQ